MPPSRQKAWARSVHSPARSKSPTLRHVPIVLQYTTIVECGVSSPAAAAALASSRSIVPSATSPSATSAAPRRWRPRTSTFRSPMRRPELLRLHRETERLLVVEGSSGPQRALEQPVAVLGRLGLLLEEPPGPPEPPARDGRLEEVPVLVREPGRDVRGPAPVARVDVAPVDPLVDLHVLLGAAGPVRNLSEELDVLGLELPFGVCRRQMLVGLVPGPARHGVASRLECVPGDLGHVSASPRRRARPARRCP